MIKKIKTRTLDTLWSKAVKAVRGDACEYCGATSEVTQIDSHHIYGRKNYGLRFLVDNGCRLCVLHHKFSTLFSAHETPLKFAKFIQTKRSKKLLDFLRLTSNKICRANEINREEVSEHLRKIINESNT